MNLNGELRVEEVDTDREDPAMVMSPVPYKLPPTHATSSSKFVPPPAKLKHQDIEDTVHLASQVMQIGVEAANQDLETVQSIIALSCVNEMPHYLEEDSMNTYC